MKPFILFIGIIFYSVIPVSAQEDDKTVFIEIKEGADPVIIIDGKKYDKEIIELIDKNKIEHIKIIKSTHTLNPVDSSHVIIISTSKGKNKHGIHGKDEFEYNFNFDIDDMYEYEINVDSIRQICMPRVIVNGVLVNPDSLRKIEPDDIIKIDVVKNKWVMTKYKTKKGVIIVTTDLEEEKKNKEKLKEKQKK